MCTSTYCGVTPPGVRSESIARCGQSSQKGLANRKLLAGRAAGAAGNWGVRFARTRRPPPPPCPLPPSRTEGPEASDRSQLLLAPTSVAIVTEVLGDGACCLRELLPAERKAEQKRRHDEEIRSVFPSQKSTGAGEGGSKTVAMAAEDGAEEGKKTGEAKGARVGRELKGYFMAHELVRAEGERGDGGEGESRQRLGERLYSFAELEACFGNSESTIRLLTKYFKRQAARCEAVGTCATAGGAMSWAGAAALPRYPPSLLNGLLELTTNLSSQVAQRTQRTSHQSRPGTYGHRTCLRMPRRGPQADTHEPGVSMLELTEFMISAGFMHSSHTVRHRNSLQRHSSQSAEDFRLQGPKFTSQRTRRRSQRRAGTYKHGQVLPGDMPSERLVVRSAAEAMLWVALCMGLRFVWCAKPWPESRPELSIWSAVGTCLPCQRRVLAACLRLRSAPLHEVHRPSLVACAHRLAGEWNPLGEWTRPSDKKTLSRKLSSFSLGQISRSLSEVSIGAVRTARRSILAEQTGDLIGDFSTNRSCGRSWC